MATSYLATDTSPQRWGNAHPNIVPYRVFRVTDGWVIVACGSDGQLRKLMEVRGEPALANGERFTINPQRVCNHQVLVPLLEPMMLGKTRAQQTAVLENAGIPCGPINDLADVFKDPHVLTCETRLDLPHPTAGHISVLTGALKISGSPIECQVPLPLLGEHTDSVLGQLTGLSTSELEELRLHVVIQANGSGRLYQHQTVKAFVLAPEAGRSPPRAWISKPRRTLLAHSKFESPVRYLSIKVDDAFEICASLKCAAKPLGTGRIYPDDGHGPS